MFIRKKNHDLIVGRLERQIDDLKYGLEKANNLESVLEILAEKTGVPKPEKSGLLMATDSGGVSWINGDDLSIPENYAELVEDYFGGKIIRQTANMLIEIDQKGVVSRHFTNKTPDKGYSYVLIRK